MVEYKYNAWGNFKVLDASGNEITDETHIGYLNPFRYRGYYYSDDLGLYYLKSRFYDPEVGRFISADTVDYLVPDSINGLNLYAYCGNNPVMNVDPSGHIPALVLALISLAPIAGVLIQVATSVLSYAGMAIASLWDEEIRNDMNAIGWNPFNSNASAVLNSEKVSFYKGAPVFRTDWARSESYYAIFLKRGVNQDELNHERGHNTQAMLLGILNYTLMIGLPSALEWRKSQYYYNRPWEVSADMFGGVSRPKHEEQAISTGYWYFGISLFFGPLGYFLLAGEY